jgi:hypothetical protein
MPSREFGALPEIPTRRDFVERRARLVGAGICSRGGEAVVISPVSGLAAAVVVHVAVAARREIPATQLRPPASAGHLRRDGRVLRAP